MKKLIALLCAVCAAAMSLCVACASPLTGDTSNMGLWITLVVVAVIAGRLVAAGRQAQGHDQRQQQRDELFHVVLSFSRIFLLTDMQLKYTMYG